MTNFETNRQSPNYLDFYSLDRAPFAEDTNEHSFYASNALTQRLNLLTHLTQFGNSAIAVTGQEGVGKTTLLNQFCDYAESGWVLCSCQASQSINLQDLLADCLHSHSNMPVKQLITDWINRTEDSSLLVLLIDDAQLLSQEILQELSTCISEPLNKRVRLLLFGTPEIASMLRQSNIEQLFDRPPQVLEVPKLSEEDTASYLMHRLTMAGYNGDNAFSPTEVRAIYKTAGGLPRETNRLAHDCLEERVTSALSQESPAARTPKKRPEVNIWLSAAVLVVAAMLWPFFFSNEPESTDLATSEQALAVPPIALNDIETKIDRVEPETNLIKTPQLTKTPAITPPEDQIIRNQLEAIPAKDTQTELSGTTDLENALNDYKIAESATLEQTDKIIETTKLEITTKKPEPSKTVTLKETAAITGLAKTAAPEKTVKSIDATKEKVAAIKPKLSESPPLNKVIKHPELADTAALEEAVKQPRITETAKKEIGRNSGLIHQEDWLLQQPGTQFTLQLLGSHNEKSLQGFIKKHNLPADQVAYYRGDRKGNDWYILVYGVFPTRDAATQQISKLPKALQTAKPWPRTIESVHIAIQQTSP